jgi:AraC family transcriptional regulator
MLAGRPFLFEYQAGFRADDAHLQPIVSVVLRGVHRQVDDAGVCHDLQPGSLCFMPAGTPHEHFAGPSGTLVLSAVVPAAPSPFSRAHHAAVRPLLRMLAAVGSGDWAAQLDGEAWREELLASLHDRALEVRPARWVEAVREMLWEQSDTDLKLSDLCAEAGYDRSHVARVFRAAYGQSLGEYLRDVRLTKAARQLSASPDTTIADAAVGAGFYDQAHFCRAFRARFGQSPALWRRLFWKSATPVQG